MTAKRAVAILGFFDSRPEAPQSGPDVEVWGINQLYAVREGSWDRWFEMHSRDFLEKWRPEHVEWLKRQTSGTIYMQQRHPDIPRSVEYPRAHVNATLGKAFGFPADYYTSSFSYMLALALHERILYKHFETIGLYGIGLIEDGESYFERAGLEYLIGLAQGHGAHVHLESGSPLMKIHYVYGYEEPRMETKDVAPVCAFLKQSVDINERTRAEMLKMDTSRFDDDKLLEWELRLRDSRVETRLLSDMISWLKHYGRGGALIRPDGTLSSKQDPT